MTSKRFAAEIKRLEETRFANQRVPASAIIDQLRGAQVAPASSGERGTVALSAATPAALGTAAAGSAGTASDGGHVHGHGDLSAAGGAMHSPAQAGAEPALGNPGTSGFVLSSTTAGARSWVAPSADVGAAIHAASAKATPVDADETAMADSAASYGLKKVTWANIKATLKAYFDGLYAALVHKSRHATGGADALSPADIGAATTSAASLTSGALADARLSSNVPLLNAANTFSAGQTIQTAGSVGAGLVVKETVAGYNAQFQFQTASHMYIFANSPGLSDAFGIYDGTVGGWRFYINPDGTVIATGRFKADTLETAAGSQWKLAGYTAAGDAASNGYVTVTIGGVSYKLMTRA